MVKKIKKIEKLATRINENKEVHLVLSDAQKLADVTSDLLSALIKQQKLRCLYISLNKEYKVMHTLIEKKGINQSKIYFIDGISKAAGESASPVNFTFISGLNSLTELSITITIALNTNNFDFLFFDSLDALLVYHDLETIERFSRYIIGKLNVSNIGGVILSSKLKGKERRLITILSSSCDNCISL